MVQDERVDELELRLAVVERRLRELAAPAPAARRPEPLPPLLARPVAPPAASRRPQAASDRPTPSRTEAADLEELLGGRVLAWVGALAVLTGLFFLLVIAVSRGWIGEVERTLMAGLVSAGLLAAGVWLHERRRRTEASLAATAAGIAGLFASFTVAGALYGLLLALPALLGALATGAVAVVLALRWEAPGIGALGIVGALLSPALVGAMPSGEGVAVLAVAMASATAVLVWQRWTWLAFAAFAIATPQWLAWIFVDSPGAGAIACVLVVFGGLGAAAAVGFELRSAAPRLRISSAVLLVLNALVLASAGWYALEETAGATAGQVWLVLLAAAHLAVGFGSGRARRVSHELSLTALSLGIVLADIAFASVAQGLPQLAGFALTGVGFAALLRRGAPRRGDEPFAAAGLGGHLLLALGQALVLNPPETALTGGAGSPEALMALAMVVAGCAVSARLAEAARPGWREALDAIGLAVLAYLTAVALDGPALIAALGAEAVALGALARRTRDHVAAWAALGYLVLAGAIAIGVHATPDALERGLDEPLQAALALGAAIGAAAALAWLSPRRDVRAALAGAAALGVLYLASVELVTPFQPGLEGLALGDLGVRQQGQALLSALWALTGFATLVAGLLSDRPELRRAALALLGVTVGKVFLYDLASLESIYRVASFIVLGLLLLGGAFAWQRVRPRALGDLRAMPEGLR
jgi:uncharacterized membrane protein